MFKIEELPYNPWPVKVRRVKWIDGKLQEEYQQFVAQFRPFGENELEEVIAKAARDVPASGNTLASGEKETTMAENLRRSAIIFGDLLVGWDDVDAEFSPEVLTGLLTGPLGLAAVKGLNDALLDLRFGLIPAVEKNSPTSPAPGTAGEVEAATAS